MYSEKYQWVKGEKAGNIENYISHDDDWVYFAGGGRINPNLINEYMMQYDGNGFEVEITKHARKEQPINNAVIQDVPVKTMDPVKTLLKQSTKTEEEFNYKILVNIPKQTVYELIKDSFECDIDELIKELIFENINKSTLYEEIQTSIKEQIINFYKNGTRKS
jgi:hypothetical protein